VGEIDRALWTRVGVSYRLRGEGVWCVRYGGEIFLKPVKSNLKKRKINSDIGEAFPKLEINQRKA
jgi:hypothetical protein